MRALDEYAIIGGDKIFLCEGDKGEKLLCLHRGTGRLTRLSIYGFSNSLKERCAVGMSIDHKTTKGLTRLATMLTKHNIELDGIFYMDSEVMVVSSILQPNRVAFCARKDELGIWTREEKIDVAFERAKLMQDLAL